MGSLRVQSPLLCYFNIYVKLLGEVIWISGVHCHQYVYNTQLYFSFTMSTADAIQLLEHHPCSMDWTRVNKLKLNPDRLGNNLPSPDGVTLTLPLKDRVRNLGIILDPA